MGKSPAGGPEQQQVGKDRWLRRVLAYTWRHKRKVVVASLASLGIAAIGVVVPLVQRTIVDDVILTKSQPLLPWAIVLVVIALLNFVVSRTRRYVGGSIGIEVQNDMRTDVFDALTARTTWRPVR
jgi:ATP-binding cassette subfamily B protein